LALLVVDVCPALTSIVTISEWSIFAAIPSAVYVTPSCQRKSHHKITCIVVPATIECTVVHTADQPDSLDSNTYSASRYLLLECQILPGRSSNEVLLQLCLIASLRSIPDPFLLCALQKESTIKAVLHTNLFEKLPTMLLVPWYVSMGLQLLPQQTELFKLQAR
jgi:hypothetical protein